MKNILVQRIRGVSLMQRGRKPYFKKKSASLEEKGDLQLKSLGVNYQFGKTKLEYKRSYIPDVTVYESYDKVKFRIEFKGWFPPEDVTKMRAVLRDNPDEDIRFVFGNANNKMPQQTKSYRTYGEWASYMGCKWSDKGIVPVEWFEEKKKE